MGRVVIIGASGHGKKVADAIRAAGRHELVGFVDAIRPAGTTWHGADVLGDEDALAALFAAGDVDGSVVAIGDNWTRSQVVERVERAIPELRFVAVVHPGAHVAPDAEIGPGAMVMVGAAVGPTCIVGAHALVDTNASLDHDSVLDAFASLAPRATTGGDVRIGRCTAIAIGACIAHQRRVGAHSVVGAGAVVVEDVPERVVAYGVPARVQRPRAEDDPYLRVSR